MPDQDHVFRLPLTAAAPARPAFPVVAALAPLAVAGLVFAVTGSGFVLLFAFLGPAIALGTLLDGRRSARRTARRDREAAGRARTALRAAVAQQLDALREEARAATPDASAILAGQAEQGRWAPGPRDGQMRVVLGSGSIPSGVRIEGAEDPASADADPDRPEVESLVRFAAVLADAPVVADVAHRVGIVGPLPVARALARAVVVQLVHAQPPGCLALRFPAGTHWEWSQALPHASARSPDTTIRVCEPGPGHRHDASCLLALAERPEQLPPGCGTLLRAKGPGRATIARGHLAGATLRPHLVSTREAALFAAALRAFAEASGLGGRQPPASVTAAILWEAGQDVPADGLACPIGCSAEGPVTVDLVTHGPHAVVGGITGSGKSELLVTWITSMAALHPPERVTFLLVDFKGGSAFRALAALPHCVGLVTDLDEREAARALASLTAEVRRRERMLREAGARDVADPAARGRVPRLVIVVDEFQAMLGAFDDLHALFADLAARGRSLGIHLILCTQRPAGVVRDAVLANCNLRLSLRVNNPADSVAVIGSPEAAALRPGEPGRCLLTAGEDVQLIQVAVTGQDDVGRVAARFESAQPARRPWLEPLPGTVPWPSLTALAEEQPATGSDGGCTRVLGLLDEPEEQRYRIARWEPRVDGNLLIIGGPGSGKSSLIATLAAQGDGGDWLVPPGAEEVWDALVTAAALLDDPRAADGRSPRHPLLLLDDIDAVFARWGVEHQAAALDLLSMLLRQGAQAGLGVVLTAQRLAAQLGPLAALCPATLLLRLSSREAHRAAGGEPAAYDATLPPGGGHWRGHRVQLLAPPGNPAQGARRGSARCAPVPRGLPVLVVSTAPARTIATLRALRGDGGVTELGGTPGARLDVQDVAAGAALVGDPDAWQSNYGLLAALRARTAMVFDGCSLGDYRLISRRSQLPPALAPQQGRVWLLAPDGTVRRATWR